MIQSDVFHCKSAWFPNTAPRIRFNFESSIAHSFFVQIPIKTFFPSTFARTLFDRGTASASSAWSHVKSTPAFSNVLKWSRNARTTLSSLFKKLCPTNARSSAMLPPHDFRGRYPFYLWLQFSETAKQPIFRSCDE